MKRLCIIGDSHTAAIKRAWWAIESEFPGMEITYFTSHRARFGGLAVEGNTLVPQTEELRDILLRSCKFEPVIAADYDRYILCGLDFSLLHAMNQLMPFRSEDQAPDNRAPVSRDCYLKAMTGILRGTISIQIARKLRQITDRPMTIIPGPMVSDANELKLYPRLRETGDAERIADVFRAACDTLGRELDATITRQPPETLRDPLQTLAVYSQDAPREWGDTPRPDGWKDYQHMNVDYGMLVMRALLAMPGF